MLSVRAYEILDGSRVRISPSSTETQRVKPIVSVCSQLNLSELMWISLRRWTRHPLKPPNQQPAQFLLLSQSLPILSELDWLPVLRALAAIPLGCLSLPQKQIKRLWNF